MLELVILPCLLLGVQEPEPTPVDPPQNLGLQLEPGTTWRQEIKFRNELTLADSAPWKWGLDYQLRIHCVEQRDGWWSLEAKFLDWRLVLDSESLVCDWCDSRYRHETEDEDSSERARKARILLRAWSEGLRLSELRFQVSSDGSVRDWKGLKPLRDSVGAALEECQPIPADLEPFFGEGGLERFQKSVMMALVVPRPQTPVSPGATWSQRCQVPGLLRKEAELERAFTFVKTTSERDYRLALVDVLPIGHWHKAGDRKTSVQIEDAGVSSEEPVSSDLTSADGREHLQLQEDEQNRANRLELWLDTGLVFRMSLQAGFQLPGEGRVFYSLQSQLKE